MNPSQAERALLYAWILWDRLFSTDTGRLLENHGYGIPKTATAAWSYVLTPGWEENLALKRLQSIFSELALENPVGKPTYFALGTADEPTKTEHTAVPEPGEAWQLAKRVRASLAETLKFLDKTTDTRVRLSHLFATMQWAMSRVAFHSQVPDASLYTVASTAAAVDVCLEQASDPQQPLLLVGLDLSGIQKYIFTIRQSTASGVGKRLRARSFTLGVLMDAIVLELLERLDLPICQVMTRSGGQAFLLLPHTEEVTKHLEALQEELDHYCLSRFEGMLTVHVASQPLGPRELFENYSAVHRAVGGKLAERKRRALDRSLIQDQVWNESVFMPDAGASLARCESCQRVGQFDAMCPDCERDTRLGAELPHADQVYLSENGTDLIFGRWHLHTAVPEQYENAIALTFGEKPPRVPCRLWWSERARHVPRNKREDGSLGGVMDFTSIAERSQGKDLLAYIKADVDHLGMLFAFGIPSNRRVATVCQVRGLSQALEDLFSSYVQRLLVERYPDIYTVFSGGDDLLLVAPWHEGVEFALTLRSELGMRSGQNPNVSLSAAVHYAKPKAPLAVVVEQAEHDLDVAKTHVRPDGRDRDQLAVFGRPISWSEGQRLLDSSEMLYDAFAQELVSASMLHELLELGLMYRAYKEKGDITGLRFVPRLRYQLKRWKKEMQSSNPLSQKTWSWFESLVDLSNHALATLPEVLRQAYFLRADMAERGGDQ